MAKSIKRNYIYNATYNVLLVLTPLITTPYTARVLQADGIGISSYAASIVQYFSLLAVLGTGSYGSREIAYCRDDLDRRSEIFWETQFLRMINTAVSLTLYLIVTGLYMRSYKLIFYIYALNILGVVCDVSWFFVGLEEFGKIVFRNLVLKVIDIAFVFLFIKAKSDLPLHIFGASAFAIIGNIAMWGYLPSYIKKPALKSLRPYRNIKTVMSLFLPSVAIQVYTVLDKSMLGMLAKDSFENGYYEQALKVSRIVLALVTSLAGVMIPRIGYLFGKNDREQISRYMYRSYNFVWCFALTFCLGVIGISDNFVPWFFGEGYDKVAGLLKISSFLILAIGINNATGVQYLIPTRRQHLFTFSVVIGAAINFFMNIILIRMYKSYGAVFASVLAETVIALVQFYMVRAEISFARVMKSGLNYFISGGAMLAVLMFMNRILTPSAVHTFMMVVAGAAVYFASLFALRDDFFLTNAARPLDFIRRKFLRRE